MGFGARARGALAIAACVLIASSHAGELTPQETRWLQGAWPVLQQARAGGLPLDVVVQPQPAVGEAPMALAFVDGRCKLVLTLRGHDEAQSMLDAIEPDQRTAVLEMMAAHEVGHCQRHVDGRWRASPLGAVATALPPQLPAAQHAAWREMQAARREEGFADLAALAWVARARPSQYAALHEWLMRERSHDTLPGSEHDTVAWLVLAADPRVFDGGPSSDRVHALWLAGLQP